MDWFLFWIILFLIEKLTFSSSNVLEFSKVIGGLNPHHLTVFRSNISKNDQELDGFLQNFFSEIPTVLVDSAKISHLDETFLSTRPGFINPRQSTVYVMVDTIASRNFNFKVYHNFLESLVLLSESKQRPKCLLTLFDRKNSILHDQAKEILQYAWDLKFLDFTILVVDDNSQIFSLNYNPFTKSYNMGISQGVNKLFSDKLINVNKYPFVLPVLNRPPLFLVEKEGINIKKVSGFEYPWLKVIIEKMNFDLNFLSEHDGSTIRNPIKKLEKNKLTMSAFVYLVEGYVLGKNVIIGDPIELTKMVVVLPKIQVPKLNFSVNMLLDFIIFLSVMLVLVVTVRCFNFGSKKWNVFYVFQNFIGVTTTQPTRNIERMIFYLISILSIIYSSGLFSTFNEVKLTLVEKNFYSYDKLNRSGMIVYTKYPLENMTNVDTNLRNFLSNVKFLKNDNLCIDELIKTRFAACILEFKRARYYVRTNVNTQGLSVMKISDLSFAQQHLALAFEKASPFAEKINKIVRSILESGIALHFRRLETVRAYQAEETESSKKLLCTILIFIWVTGCLSATVVFFIELAYSRNKKKLIRRIFLFNSVQFLKIIYLFKKKFKFKRRD